MIAHKFFSAILVILAILGLAGCYGDSERMGGGSFESAQQWSNYKCYAVNTQTGKRHMGWATDSGRARSIAIEKCRSQGGSCRAMECAGE